MGMQRHWPGWACEHVRVSWICVYGGVAAGEFMNVRRRIVVVGAGGQAREVRWVIEEINSSKAEAFEFIGFIVSDLSRLCGRDSKDYVLGDYRWLHENKGNYDALALGIGTPGARKRVAGDLETFFGSEFWPPIVHPSVLCDRGSCDFAPGVYVGPGVVGTVNVSLARHSMINFGATIGHEATVGDYSVINPGANISGGVEIGSEVLVGTGAKVLQYLKVGDCAVVGAGAVVTKDVLSREVVVGIPAKPQKRIDCEPRR